MGAGVVLFSRGNLFFEPRAARGVFFRRTQGKKTRAHPKRKPTPTHHPTNMPPKKQSRTGGKRRSSGDAFQVALTKPAIRRLCRRGGVKRISGHIYESVRTNIAKPFLEKLLSDAVTYMEHGRRKTIMAMDIVYAYKHQTGKSYYGAKA